MVKAIGVAIVKDSAQTDASEGISGGQTSSGPSSGPDSPIMGRHSEGNSEVAWLQKLPGYTRVRKQLFQNLMTATPDLTKQNIRVDSSRAHLKSGYRKDDSSSSVREELSNGQQQGVGGGGNGDAQQPAVSSSSSSMKAITDLSAESCLDRDVIKSISNLYVERGSSRMSSRNRSRNGHRDD